MGLKRTTALASWAAVSTCCVLGAGCRAEPNEQSGAEPTRTTVRVALFNVRELTAEKLEQVDEQGRGSHPQLLAAAQIIRQVDPDVLVLQEIDFPLAIAERFVRHYLAKPAGSGEAPWRHLFAAPSNTGTLTGLDLDGDGHVATDADRGERRHGNDSYGYGVYPGQYAMALLSKLPIDRQSVRTFQNFLWRQLPGNHMPEGFYSEQAEQALRLSSKSHWDVPVEVGGGRRLHLWVSHPTPPSFDGPEDRNGRRNHDEVGFWRHYLENSQALVDDNGRQGGFGGGAPFVIVGDLNARPQSLNDFALGKSAISQLLDHDLIQESGSVTVSTGALQGRPPGPPDYWERATARFLDGSRVDYVLPSHDLTIRDGGVFWPSTDDDPEGAALAERASDHHLVWLDLELAGPS